MQLRRLCVFTNFGLLGLVCLGALSSLGALPAWSQATSTNTITGQVTDPSNAAIAGAEVKLIDTSTNIALTTVTNETGRYIFVNVPSGTYNLAFTKTGFNQEKV